MVEAEKWCLNLIQVPILDGMLQKKTSTNYIKNDARKSSTNHHLE